MSKLIFEDYQVDVTDYARDRDFIIIDIQLKTKEEMKEFVEFHKKHFGGSIVFEYEIDGQKYSGWCGTAFHDKNYKVRLNMYISEYKETDGGNISTFRENTIRILNKQRKAILELTSILKNNDLIDDKQSEKISEDFSDEYTEYEMCAYVEDMKEYLKTTKTTLEDIRSRSI